MINELDEQQSYELLATTTVGRIGFVDEGLVDGLRVDHPDGLRDPVGYLASLAEATGDAYVLVEKILEPGEELPTTWPTAGTTGYDVLAHVDRLLTDPAGEQPLTDLAPSVERLATTLDPAEVEALVTLIDRLPQLVTHLDEDVLPVLESLGGVGTDVHDLLDTVQDLRQIVKGFPGSRLFRRRGAEEIAQEEAERASS